VNKNRQRSKRSSQDKEPRQPERTPVRHSRPEESEAAQSETPGQPGHARTLVIIDDNKDVAQTLADVLEIAGHRVEVALTGRSGIDLVRRVKPQFVICDLGLPDLNGFEVARILRRDRSLRATRLIALSGYTQQEDQDRAREAGFDSHLAKPPSPDELDALLAVWPKAARAGKQKE
jgi:CheY-like chemotaxis protein